MLTTKRIGLSVMDLMAPMIFALSGANCVSTTITPSSPTWIVVLPPAPTSM